LNEQNVGLYREKFSSLVWHGTVHILLSVHCYYARIPPIHPAVNRSVLYARRTQCIWWQHFTFWSAVQI